MRYKIVNYFALLAAFALLVFAVQAGIKHARRLEQAKVVLANSLTLRQGLQFFYNDNEHYPKVSEFSSVAVMQPYFSNYPPQEFTDNACPKIWQYQRPDPEFYILNFCLPTAAPGYAAGWQKVTARTYAPPPF